MSGIEGYYADSRSVQSRDDDDTVTVTIPAPVAEELGFDGDSDALFQMGEGYDHCRLENPSRVESDSARVSKPADD